MRQGIDKFRGNKERLLRIISLREIDKFTYQQIADKENITKDRVRQLYYRAKICVTGIGYFDLLHNKEMFGIK